jgi:DNA-binding response OmpR family regulator
MKGNMMSKAKRILIVDNEKDVIQGARIWLTHAGFDVETAGDGDEAISQASATHPDAIIMDVRMPRKNGLVALDELKHQSDTCDIPIVMLSASLVDEQRALDSGARFFMKKPYTGKELVEAVEIAVEEHDHTIQPHQSKEKISC